jgi:hypothetical protein
LWRKWGPEALLCLLSGALFVFLADKRLADVHGLAPWNTADFVDYCAAVLNMAGEDAPWPTKRAQLPGLLPLVFYEGAGMAGALRAGAVISTFLVGCGLYGWGRVLAGRTAGLLSVVAALAFAPVTRLPRMLSFYPEVTAMLVIGAALVTAGLLSKKARGLAWAGAGIGLVLCADVRGLVWAVPWMGAALWVLWKSEARRTAAKWLFVPLMLSFLVGRWSFPAGTESFESQLDVRPLYHEVHDSQMPEHLPPYGEGGAFVWGRSAPWRLPQTGAFVLHQLGIPAPPDFPPDVSAFSQDDHLKPLVKVWWMAGLLSVVLFWRDRRVLAVLGVGVLPFAVGFAAQHGMAEIFARFLAQLLPGLAVLFGICVGRVVDRCPGLGKEGTRWHFGRQIAAVGMGLVLILGNLASPVSPHAGWRRPWPYVGEIERVHPERHAQDLNERGQACVEGLRSDQAAGRWIPSGSGRPLR